MHQPWVSRHIGARTPVPEPGHRRAGWPKQNRILGLRATDSTVVPPAAPYLPAGAGVAPPDDFMKRKKSELGSTTITSRLVANDER